MYLKQDLVFKAFLNRHRRKEQDPDLYLPQWHKVLYIHI
jgi:hypothetical protein